MAKAEKTTVVETVEVLRPGVSLELTDDEAQFIVDLFSKIGGSPENSRRRHADDIRTALEDLGYSWSFSNTGDISNSIRIAER